MKRDILQELIDQNNGYLKITDAAEAGISKTTAIQFAKEKKMKRESPGIYVSENAWPDLLYLLQIRSKKIIYSHETALVLHELSDREPMQPTVTVKRGYNAMHLTAHNIVVHTVRAEWFEVGLTTAITTAGNEVILYDKERCICDIIRNRNKMDVQVFQTAMKSYFSDMGKDIHRLMKYSQQMHMEKKICQYTEVLL